MDLKPLHLQKTRVLVLEEDPYLYASLCGVLSGAGYAVVDPARPVNVDLVLASLRMQGASTAPLFEGTAPVIGLVDRAAWTGFEFFDAANALGAVAVLQRPFSRTALLQLIAAVLAHPVRQSTAPHELPDVVDLPPRPTAPHFA